MQQDIRDQKAIINNNFLSDFTYIELFRLLEFHFHKNRSINTIKKENTFGSLQEH